jgi:hypothetical protein
LEVEYRGRVLVFSDDYWNGVVVEAITKKIYGNLNLRSRYDRGEKINMVLSATLLGEQGEEIKIPLEVSKPLPIMGRVLLEAPQGTLKLEIPRLRIAKKITLDEQGTTQIEEGTIEQARGE